MADQKTTVDAALLMPWERKAGSDVDAATAGLFDALSKEDQGAAEPEKQDQAAAEGDEATDEEVEPTAAEPADESSDDKADEDDEPEDEAEPEAATFTVTVDGQPVEVTRDEFIRGYSLTADYTRKTQQLAEQRRTAESELGEARAQRERYAAKLTTIEQMIKDATPKEPDWDQLQKADPTRYVAEYARHQRLKQNLKAVQDERERVEREAVEDAKKQLASLVQLERERLQAAVPEWEDAEARTKDLTAMSAYAQSVYGYTAEELSGVVDHRLMVILRKAMLFDAQRAKGKQAIQARREVSKTLPPGSPGSKPRGKAKERAARVAQLKQTGSVRDATAVIFDMLSE